MTAHNDRAVIHGVDCAYYNKVLQTVGEQAVLRLAYDGKDLEVAPSC